jgi:hypothetical protein
MKARFYDQFVRLRALLKHGFIGLIVVCAPLSAKVIDITLAELVQKSELVACGRTAKPAKKRAESTVLFSPITVLKGQQIVRDQKIYLCKMPASSESYDLSTIEEDYIVFASLDGRCYRPVHWISSIIMAKDDLVKTSAIADQPEYQALSDFIQKIQDLVGRTTLK